MTLPTAPRRPVSLFRDLLKSLLVPGLLVGAIGLVIVHNLVEAEYDELQDIGLHAKAQLLMEIYQANPDSVDLGRLTAFEVQTLDPDERTSYWFKDAQGQTTAQS